MHDSYKIHEKYVSWRNREMYTVGFQVGYKYVGGLGTVLEDRSWWLELARKTGSNADVFEIRCWPGENEAIATGRRFGEQVENNESREIVFRGPVSEAFLQHVCEEGFDECGMLKYFTLYFYKGNEPLFQSEHYGTEPYFFLKTEEEVQKLEEWSRGFPSITRVDVFNNAEC